MVTSDVAAINMTTHEVALLRDFIFWTLAPFHRLNHLQGQLALRLHNTERKYYSSMMAFGLVLAALFKKQAFREDSIFLVRNTIFICSVSYCVRSWRKGKISDVHH
jgi:hypothetical protein